MLLFFSFCSFAVLTAYIAEKTKKRIWILFTIFFLSFLVGFRANSVGTDTGLYYNVFNRLLNSVRELPFKEEPGFSLTAIFLVKIFKNVESVFIFFGFFTNALIISRLWSFKNKGSFTLMVLFYTCVFYPQNMNIMRQYSSLAICFYATKFLDKKRYPLYVFLILIATTFHLSSVVALFPLAIHYWIDNKSTVKRGLVFITCLILAPIFLYVLISIFNSNYSSYFETEKMQLSAFFVLSIMLFVAYLLLLVFNKDKKLVFDCDKEASFISSMYAIGLILNVVGCFYDQMGRIALSYKLFEIPFVAMASKNNKFSLFYKVLYVLIALYYIFIKVAINGESGIMPFKLFFN